MYKTTHLEDWIYKKYNWLKIVSPEDINPVRICREFSIFLNYKELPSHSLEQVRFRSITIDSRLSKEQQHEEFFHELCHLLRHCGKHYMLPKAFLELQENQANTFAMYATLPYYMLQHYDLNEYDIVPFLSENFTVTESLVVKRLEQIKNRILLYKESKELNGHENSLICSSID
ncbi:hypothetical protein BHU72_11780 [Desulfuribacillus stibiiarsenatis]|uniref:IrrE N-terminal-like domain-containing protein n=1 Tax=Desulfuribacillus stibiiarsenatis TaxID=1390249 RepID=A0A1E5L7T2_9FIRM|nr:ImmA/IrrE family metallo-endopeptidase [Desulfuribacillus stibiiarsenatis]OEH86210.1 hypothetical protein BHU72_11780 [Desulfuribacillus stibiiarsenatis]